MDEKFKSILISLLHYMKDEAYKPLTVQELEAALGIEDSQHLKILLKHLFKWKKKD